MITKTVLAVGFLSAAAPAYAALNDDIATCVGVRDDKARLECFDAAAKMMLSRMQSAPEGEILKRFKKEQQNSK